MVKFAGDQSRAQVGRNKQMSDAVKRKSKLRMKPNVNSMRCDFSPATHRAVHRAKFPAASKRVRRIIAPKPATRLFVNSPMCLALRFTKDGFQNRPDRRCPQLDLLHHLFRVFRHQPDIALRDQQMNRAARATGTSCRVLHMVHVRHFITMNANANYFSLNVEQAFHLDAAG